MFMDMLTNIQMIHTEQEGNQQSLLRAKHKVIKLLHSAAKYLPL